MNSWGVIYEGAATDTFDSEAEAAGRREELVAEALADDPDFDVAEYTIEQVCKHGWPLDYCQDDCDEDEESEDDEGED